MRTAFYTYSYIDRLGMEPAVVLPKVAQAGYGGFDLSATWRNDEDPGLFPAERRREIAKLANDLGLRCEALVTHLSLTESLRDGRPINLRGGLELAAELRCPIVTVHIGPPLPEDKDGGWVRVVDHFCRVCARGAELNVRLLLDAVFPNFLTPNAASVARMIQDVGSPMLGHNYDPSYTEVCGLNLHETALTLRGRIHHVHLKDHFGRYPGWQHRIPGEGEMDNTKWVAALREIEFDGAVAVECFTDMPLERALTVGRNTLRAAGVG